MAPDTAARATSPLRPETPANLASRARSATLIGAAGLATFFAVVAVTRNIFLFDLGRVAWLFSGLILLNLGLAATAPRWAPWRWAIYVYEAFQVIVLSIILHRLGGLMMGILLITYAFPVIHGEMLRSDSSVFATANLCGACYAVMAWVEHEALRDVGVETQQQIAFVAIAFLTLNFLALYANRYGYQLRNLAWHLQAKVAERTAELSAVNAELAAKARALEEKQDELKSFVYTVTHDLKSPLSAILLIADLLLQREGTGLAAEGRGRSRRSTAARSAARASAWRSSSASSRRIGAASRWSPRPARGAASRSACPRAEGGSDGRGRVGARGRRQSGLSPCGAGRARGGVRGAHGGERHRRARLPRAPAALCRRPAPRLHRARLPSPLHGRAGGAPAARRGRRARHHPGAGDEPGRLGGGRGRGARRGSTSVPRQALARAGPARDDRRVLEGARACRRASC